MPALPVLALPLSLTALSPGRAETVVDGETFAETAATTVNVMRLHLEFLEAQNDYDLASIYALADARSAKAGLLLVDGQRLEGGVTHALGGIGLGYGHPREGLAIFGGFHMDELRAGSFPLGSELEGFQASRRDQLAYLGLGVLGTQASYGWRRVSRMQGVAPEGDFVPGELPDQLAEQGDHSAQVITVYQRSGAGLGAMISPMLETGSYTVDEAKEAVLAALHGEYEPRGMTGAAGQAALGFNRLHEGMDFYREGSSGDGAMWEVPITLRDIGEWGLGVQLVPQVAPDISLRSAQAWWNLDVGSGLLGGRVAMTQRNGEPDWSWDVYAQAMGVVFGDHLLTTAALALAYSYNSPDGDTFLPYSGMHVFALQLNLGVPGIHPIAPPASGWRSAAFDDVDPGYDIYQTRGEDTPLEAVPEEPPEPSEPLPPPPWRAPPREPRPGPA
jgi:hypothetical protein